MHTVRPRRLGVRGPATVLLAASTALVLVGCGDADPGAGSTPTGSSTPSVTTPTDDATSTPGETTSETATETPPATPPDGVSKPAKARIKVEAGVVTGAPERLSAVIGQTVRIVITSDVADELHVHGIEQKLELTAGQKQTLEFVVPDAPGPGLYDVELHTGELLLFQLEVT